MSSGPNLTFTFTMGSLSNVTSMLSSVEGNNARRKKSINEAQPKIRFGFIGKFRFVTNFGLSDGGVQEPLNGIDCRFVFRSGM